MYGLINKALKTMILDGHGNDVWNRIIMRSGVSEDSFLSMQRYDDSITYALVGATSEVLEASAEDCLEIFGHYWATVTAPSAYGMLMDSTGNDLIGFLENVNGLHDRITSTFVGYIPPHFVVKADSNEVCLRYESQREGLTPFVIGVVKGLAERFKQKVHFGSVEKCSTEIGEISLIYFTVDSDTSRI